MITLVLVFRQSFENRSIVIHILYNEPMKTLGSGQSSTMNEHKTKDCAGLRPSSTSMLALLSAPLKFAEFHNYSLYQLSLNSPTKSTREN